MFLLKLIFFLRPFFSYVIFFWPAVFFSIILLSILPIYIIINKIDYKRIKPISPYFFLFVLGLGVSLIFSKNFFLSLGQLHNYIIYFLAFFVSFSFSNEQKIQIINTFLLSSLIISILAIIQYLWGLQPLFNYLKKYNLTYDFSLNYIQTKRAFFPFSTPNALAGFLIMSIPFILEGKIFSPLLCVVLTALILSKSIGAFISLSIGLSLYFYLKEKKVSLKIIKIIFLLIFLLTFFIFLRQKTLPQIKLSLSVDRRWNYWKQTSALIKMHPFIGWGLGNFQLTSTRYSHNLILQILAETGFLGLIAFLWFIIISFRFIFLNIKNSKDKNLYLKILIANIIFLIHNLIDFTFFLPEVSFFWWVILGMGI